MSKKKRAAREDPLIGIWWDDGTTLVALAHSCQDCASVANMLSSNLEHVVEWGKVASAFGRTEKDEYASVPRGRVVFDVRNNQGLIYHGAATSPSRLALIAKRFRLRRWKAIRDAHYAFGPEIDEVFEEE
jgi:hypothetical protein